MFRRLDELKGEPNHRPNYLTSPLNEERRDNKRRDKKREPSEEFTAAKLQRRPARQRGGWPIKGGRGGEERQTDSDHSPGWWRPSSAMMGVGGLYKFNYSVCDYIENEIELSLQ